MGFLGFVMVLVIIGVMLVLSGVKLITNLLGFIAFISLFYGIVLLVAHLVIKLREGENGLHLRDTKYLGIMFLATGGTILICHIISCTTKGTPIDLIDFFFMGLRKSIW